MAHFASIDEDNIVTQVIVVGNGDLLNEAGVEVEDLGIDFLENLTGHRNWIQTSYNNNFRFRYAGIGMKYYSELDAFGPSEPPFPSWIFDDTIVDFVAPIPMPDEGAWFWSEDDLNWVEEGGE